ncbi:hypothetical protein PUNSTDRAFT_129851 [Punctularia strigosozonata HHB-11173 SS5]|uniref:uncharacterized protein n=1 Tax=Punctularia strigosozonata (strain HHB-11173) TaxID=741275 RepID=UPI00044182B3|nr:uncharacterized protein PUNSTDRAFT_129851 [Punctularia strigosozonata HHB-11173 SS5]EIN14218.1 hypothetical protein PUNSTDRAFT_129851 [Punctularia strigosozonata HHB-11173 SS5]
MAPTELARPSRLLLQVPRRLSGRDIALDSSVKGVGFAVLLGFGLIIIVLSIVKCYYLKHRRIQVIHSPYSLWAPSRATMASGLSRTSTRLSFGSRTSPSSSSYSISPRTPQDQASHTSPKRKSRLSGFFVGLLGSPSWEIRIRRVMSEVQRLQRPEDADGGSVLNGQSPYLGSPSPSSVKPIPGVVAIC